MLGETSTSRLYYSVCCFVLFFVAAAASFNGFYAKWHFREAEVTGYYKQAGFESMVDGTASRPYVYRQMLPSIANWMDRIVPQAEKTRCYHNLIRQIDSPNFYPGAMAFSPTARNETYFFGILLST